MSEPADGDKPAGTQLVWGLYIPRDVFSPVSNGIYFHRVMNRKEISFWKNFFLEKKIEIVY